MNIVKYQKENTTSQNLSWTSESAHKIPPLRIASAALNSGTGT